METATQQRRLSVKCRNKTQDPMVFKEVLVENCYELPDKFLADDVILDVGAHIGCFALACLLRDAGTVFSFEPDADNFALLIQNVEPFDGAVSMNVAIWRNDRNEEVTFSGYPESSTACGSVLPGCMVGGQNLRQEVKAVSLDAAIELAPQIRLLKLDCEGAEYPAVYTSQRLDRVDEIVGECHDLVKSCLSCNIDIPGFKEEDYTLAGMMKFLSGQGFEVRGRMTCELNGIFWAKRR